MKVDRTSPQATPATRRKDRSDSSSGGGFARSMGSGDTAATGSAPGAGGVTGLDALLALQEVPDAVAERSKARRQGERILDRLEDLRLALLEGRVPESTMTRLVDEIEVARGETDDPQLNELLDAVDLRARVELAKLGR